MNAITKYYEQAELALAAYFTLSPGISGKDYTDALEDKGNGMAPTQATAFAAKWNVVDQHTDPTTGISATVFQEIATGKRALAIRGTGDLADIGADIDLAVGLPMELNLQYIALKTQVKMGSDTIFHEKSPHQQGRYERHYPGLATGRTRH